MRRVRVRLVGVGFRRRASLAFFGYRPLAKAAPAAHPAPSRTEVAETFDSMGLHENLLRGIYAYGASGRLCWGCGATAAEP